MGNATFLSALRLASATAEDEGEEATFPFGLPIVQSLRNEVELHRPVTFFVGENGTGKSTLLEGIGVRAGCVAIGSADLEQDPTLAEARRLSRRLVLARRAQPEVKMFFRAEDSFGFTRRVQAEAAALAEMEDQFREQFEDGSWGQRLAMGTARGQREALERRYGEDPDARSHGESFLHLLESRIQRNGLYLLDEPETPLSPLRILSLLSLLKASVDQGCQFLIATHSPMLLAFPEAEILVLDSGRLRTTPYDDVEHVQLTRSFLRNPARYLRRL